jgi:hypothetical protein
LYKIPDIKQVRQRLASIKKVNEKTRSDKELKLLNKRLNKQLLSGKDIARADVPIDIIDEYDICDLLGNYTVNGYCNEYIIVDGSYYLTVWVED